MKKVILNTGDNSYYETQKVQIGDVVFETLRSKKAPNGDFLPASATDLHGKKLWNFKDENFTGIGKFVEYHGEYFICLEDRQRVICKVILVSDLPKIQKVKLDSQEICIGGTPELELYRLKVEIGKLLKREVYLSENEKSMVAKANEIRLAKIKEDRLRKQEELAAKERARLQRITEILGRETITAYTSENRKRFGLPVVGDEWMSLSDDTPVVLVDNLENKNPSEAFFVKKNAGGRVYKGSPVNVFATKRTTVKKEEAAITATGILDLIINGEYAQVLCFSRENLNLLRKSGVNSGTMVAVGEPNAAGKYQVVQLKGNECLTVGEFAPQV